MNWLFIAVSFVVVVVFLFFLPQSLCFFYRDDPPRRFFYIICSRPAPWRISSPSWNAYGQLVKLVHNSACGSSSGWFLQKFEIWLLGTKLWTATEQQLSAWMRKGLWKIGQSFILAGFTLSLPCSASCGTEQTTIDTGCDPALPRNCVEHLADCNLFKTITLLNSQ